MNVIEGFIHSLEKENCKTAFEGIHRLEEALDLMERNNILPDDVVKKTEEYNRFVSCVREDFGDEDIIFWVDLCRERAKRGKTGDKKTSASKASVKDAPPKTAPFEPLKSLDIQETAGIIGCDTDRFGRVCYDPAVPVSERVPGLLEFIEKEAWRIEEAIERTKLSCDHSVEEFQILLSPLEKKRIYRDPASLDRVRRVVEKYKDAGFGVAPVPELEKAMKDQSFTDVITGEFCRSKGNVIILYYRVLNTGSTERYLAEVRRTLAHEMLHLHHFAASRVFCDESTEALRVREALADAFCVMYCLDKENNQWTEDIQRSSERVAKKVHSSWINRRGSELWPYWYALFLLPECEIFTDDPMKEEDSSDWSRQECLVNYRVVWECSLGDMDLAYQEMVRTSFSAPSKSSARRSQDPLPFDKNGIFRYSMITVPKEKAEMLNENELYDITHPEKTNSKDALAPLFIRDFLTAHENEWFSARQIRGMLVKEYEVEVKENAVRRILVTLALYSDGVVRITRGKDHLFSYTREIPEGHVSC